MRKILSCILGAGILLSSAAVFTACDGTSPRARYRMAAEYFPETRTLTAEMTAEIPNNSQNVWEELKFELYANAYREGAVYKPVSDLFAPSAYYKGESYGGIQIDAVEGGEYEVKGEDENILLVKLPSALYPSERAEVKISFTVTLAEVNHRLGAGENTVNLSHFYPALCAYGEEGFCEYVYSYNGDPFVGECADFDVTLTVPQELTVACAGACESSAQNGKCAYHVIAEEARDVAFVLGKFSRAEANANGVPVEYYYFRDSAPERTLKAATDSLGYFSRTFCDYDYPRYVLAQADFPYGGMEYTGLSLISADLRREEIPVVVAHETAHQWWYAMVGSNQFENAWQDEGLAEFSTALFLSAYPEYGSSYSSVVSASENSYRAFFSVYSQLHGEANTAMTRPLTSFASEYEYRNIAYDKGFIMFDRVRGALGDRRFFSALQRYAREYCGKIAAPEDLISCFGSANEGLFLSFIEGLCVI